jgi:hypothetical protein
VRRESPAFPGNPTSVLATTSAFAITTLGEREETPTSAIQSRTAERSNARFSLIENITYLFKELKSWVDSTGI